MQLPPGAVDPIFMHQLALELGIPVAEMCERMSAKELTVDWPLFFAYRERERTREAERQAQGRGR